MSTRPTIVLVHGAFANAGCWAKLIPLPRAKRFSVAPSNCPLSSLKDDVDAVRQTIIMQDGPVLLVGHSWGGAIITETGNKPQVRGLIYIAAAAPDSAQSFNDWWKDYPAARPGLPEIKPYGKDRFVLTLDGFRNFFAHDLATDEIELLYCTQGPHAAAANNEQITHAAWRTNRAGSYWASRTTCSRSTSSVIPKRIGAHRVVLQSSTSR
jgi:pimeloyl-ACP methyl ester carboxylesterase